MTHPEFLTSWIYLTYLHVSHFRVADAAVDRAFGLALDFGSACMRTQQNLRTCTSADAQQHHGGSSKQKQKQQHNDNDNDNDNNNNIKKQQQQ